ncbi:MAG: dihydropteroate synthase [Niabella sp.]
MFTLNCNGRLLTIDSPIVMGVINVNNDSFYSGSRQTIEKDILATAETMLEEGATILDIGGQSTRPGSIAVLEKDELERVVPVIASIQKHFPESFISIDTYYASVAKQAVDVGAGFVNDISAGSMDADMWEVIAGLNVPYVLMHMKGTPATMQQNPQYDDVLQEVLDFMIQKKAALQERGIKDIIIDPGYGFGKTIDHNFMLLENQQVFKMLDCPVLLGISRKSTIYKTLNTDAENALNGTTVLNTIGLLQGADILRVHDVKPAMEAIKLVERMNKNPRKKALHLHSSL